MAEWIFDEEIDRTTVKMFKDEGIDGLHIEYDLSSGGIDDQSVIQLAKKHKKTLLTSNYKCFVKKIKPQTLLNTYGLWILNTDDPHEQVRLVKLTLKKTSLTTKKLRKEKRVYIKKDCVEILDCRSQSSKIVTLLKK